MRRDRDSPTPGGPALECFGSKGGAKVPHLECGQVHGRLARSTGSLRAAPWLWLGLVIAGCGGTLDAGRNVPHDAGTLDVGGASEGELPEDAARDARRDTGTFDVRDAAEGEPFDAGNDAAHDASASDVNDADANDADANVAKDADSNAPDGLLPIDKRNPVIIDNDGWSDNWHGEYSVLMANGGGPILEGIIIGASSYWPDLAANLDGWKRFVTAARSSGLQHVPDITEGASKPLTQPDSGLINSTTPIGSAGAHLIVDLSRQLAVSGRPVVILAGSQLTDIADAYLLDPTVVDRVVVAAALGRYKEPKGIMSGPNGDLDPWADWIVAQRFRFIQIGIDYDQAADVTGGNLPNLPKNPFGDWMAAKQPNLSSLKTASDQTTVLAAGLPTFVRAVQRSSADTSAGFNSPPGQGPPLVPNATGKAWVVTEIAAPLGPSILWQLLLDPHTFGP